MVAGTNSTLTLDLQPPSIDDRLTHSGRAHPLSLDLPAYNLGKIQDAHTSFCSQLIDRPDPIATRLLVGLQLEQTALLTFQKQVVKRTESVSPLIEAGVASLDG